MKVKLNPMFKEVSGQLDDVVFRRVRGEIIAASKPTVTAEPSAEQVAHRDRFKQAAAYGKSVMADSSLRALYQVMADNKNIPVFAATVADFLNLPTIVEVDASEYNGQAGGIIKVVTSDDFGVVNLQVMITDADEGTTIESGQAVETPTGTGYWYYTATSNASAGILAGIEVRVTDRPGNEVTQRGTKAI